MPHQSFYPPQLSPSFVKLLQSTAPWLVRRLAQIELAISTEPKVQLSELQNSSCLLLCNHPTFNDPLVMFLFSGIMQRPFYYLAAYERFGGFAGWWLQKLGAYSIRRGLADRDSISQTLKLLAKPDSKLVIFPEGGCSFQNDTVMPFRPGAVQMALQALSKQAKQSEPRDSYLVPLSLKYRYTGQMAPIIAKSLRRLEQALHLQSIGDPYERLRLIAAAVIQRLEQEYGLTENLAEGGTTSQDTDWNQRIAALKAHILEQSERRLNLSPAPHEPNRERVYRMQHSLEKRYYSTEDGLNNIIVNGVDEWEVMRKSLARVLNFDAIYDGYVAEQPTPERFLDTLTRLEREVFNIDQPVPKAPQQALLRVGQPLNLKQYLTDYKQDRAATVAALTQQLQQTVQHNLNVLTEATTRDISW
jgi:1-acyl-sn-glycerol-3-phosphate acyltransferase